MALSAEPSATRAGVSTPVRRQIRSMDSGRERETTVGRRPTRVPLLRPGRRTILVVDDNAETRLALTAVLGIRGHRTAEAADGAQALAHLHRDGHDVALVVLDLYMPGVDGRAFLGAKAADAAIRDIPVVVYSAVDGSGLPPDIPYIRKGTSTADHLLDVIEASLAGA
jgi:CheY-like chemotaxis protein